jgi:hypothetical protein
MRSPLAAAVVVFAVACYGADKAADTTAAAPATPPAPAAVNIADLKGTWAGVSMPQDRDTVVASFDMMMTGAMEGNTLTLNNGARSNVTVLSVGGDSVVSTAGPFASAVRRGQQVTVHSIMHFRGDSLTGVTHSKYSNGDSATFRLKGSRKAP